MTSAWQADFELASRTTDVSLVGELHQGSLAVPVPEGGQWVQVDWSTSIRIVMQAAPRGAQAELNPQGRD